MDDSHISNKKCDWSFFDFKRSVLSIEKENELDIKFRGCNNRGERFEVLVEYLLNHIPLFNRYRWKHTRQTHDGKRDFEGTTENNEMAWGECKNYSSKISVNIISPTLVMSVIDGINTIYIFSLNKVNRTFKSYVNKFSESANKKVILFEDVGFENLIISNLQYVSELKQYIGNIPTTQTVIEPLSIEVILLNTFLQETNENAYDETRLQLNERIILSITVQNQLSQSQTLKLLVRGNRYFTIDAINDTNINSNSDKQIEINIEIGEIKTVFVYCRLNRIPPNDTANLPTVQYAEKNNGPDSWVSVFENKKISIQKTYCVPLLEHSLQLKNDLLEKIQNKELIRTFIVGSSGTGKSRLLKELYSDLFCLNRYNKNYSNIVYIDADSINSSATLIRRLLLGFAGLSNDAFIATDEQNIQMAEADNTFACIKYIIGLDEKSINGLMKTIIIIFNRLCKINKTNLLFFDNLQFADKFVTEVIRQIDCDYIFTVNTDYATNNLQKLFKQKHCDIKIIRLTAGKSHFVKDYLINAFNDRLSDIDALYDAKKRYTPLFLYHYIQYLMENGIIALVDNDYLINDPVALCNCRSKLTKESDVIKRRIAFLLQKYNISRIQTALTLLSVMGHVPIDDFDELKEEFTVLINHNVAKIVSTDYILTHQMISSVFRKEYLTDDVWTETSNYLSPITKEQYDYVKFIACFNSSMTDNNNATKIFEIFFSKSLYYFTDKQNLFLIFESVEKCIFFFKKMKNLTTDKIKSIIRFYSWYSLSMQQMYGFDWRLNNRENTSKDNNRRIFDRLSTEFLIGNFDDAELNTLMYGICREYFNRLLVKSKYAETDENTDQLINTVNNVKDSDDKFFWLSMCYNRKSVALSAMNDAKADEVYELARNYSLRDKLQRNLVNTLYDEGYRYYNDWRCYNKSIVVKNFNAAIAKKEKRTCIEDYQEALAMLLESKYEDAYNLLNKCLADYSTIYDYYLCKMHILRSYLDFMRSSKKREIQKSLKRAENVVTEKFAREMQFYIFFLKGKFLDKFNPDNKKLICFYYCNALKSYISTHSSREQKEKFIPFYYAVIKKLNDLNFNNWNKLKKYDEITRRLVDEFLVNKSKLHYIESIPKGIIVDPQTQETYPSL